MFVLASTNDGIAPAKGESGAAVRNPGNPDKAPGVAVRCAKHYRHRLRMPPHVALLPPDAAPSRVHACRGEGVSEGRRDLSRVPCFCSTFRFHPLHVRCSVLTVTCLRGGRPDLTASFRPGRSSSSIGVILSFVLAVRCHACAAGPSRWLCVGVQDSPVCWICLDSERPHRHLVQPCACPRFAHAHCLARWQLQSAGSR